MPDHSPDADLLEYAYPYALDALPDTEREALEERVRNADTAAAAEFRATVRDVRETLASLTIVDAHPAPPRVEESLQAALDRQSGSVTPLPRRVRPMRWLAAAAALIVALGIGAVITMDLAPHRDRATVTAQELRAEPDARETSRPVTGGGTATVIASPRLDIALLSFGEVPAAPATRTYQLWLIPQDGQPVSAGVLPTLPTANDPMLLRLNHAQLVALSLEPAGGSVLPTTDPVVAVPLT